MSDKREEKVSLYYSEGSSDKEYHAELKAAEGGFVVQFRYGRRGQAMQSGTKTPTPISYEKAKGAYDKLVKEKLAKGYTPAEGGAAYQGTAKETQFTGELPQLLNPVKDDAELEELMKDDAFVLQEKMNGERRLIRINRMTTKPTVEGINRKGLIVALPVSIEQGAGTYPVRHALLDGEQIGEVFHAFDLLYIETESTSDALRGRPYAERWTQLSDLITKNPQAGIVLVGIAKGEKAKRARMAQLKAANAEGVVFKNETALYAQGRPASAGSQRKYKFISHATCRVAKVSETKKSLALELLDDKGAWVGVGNAGYAALAKAPKKGALVEVQYLYAYRGGSLYQPVLVGERTDVDEGAAVLSQLKYKPDSSEDEEA